MKVLVPPGSLVLLVGISGSGKSTLAASVFPASAIISSDSAREMVSDDVSDQGATRDAFEVVSLLVRLRLRRALTTVVDATNVKAKDRAGLWRLAADAGRPTVALLFDVPLEVAAERNAARARRVPEKVLSRQLAALQASRDALPGEVDHLYVLGPTDSLEVTSSSGDLDLARFASGFWVDSTAGPVEVPAGGVAAALEVLDRFSVERSALCYLPPTMSPVETSRLGGFLEHPLEAFEHYRREGVEVVVCEEKHMGSRGALLLCRDVSVASRFGLSARGALWTRRGRVFFDSPLATGLFERAWAALEAAGLEVDWALLDVEVLPWNLRPGLVEEFAAVSTAGLASVAAELSVLERATARGLDVEVFSTPRRDLVSALESFRAAYLPFCWSTSGLSGVRLAPFQLLATSDGVVDLREVDHVVQLRLFERMALADPDLFAPTGFRVLSPGDLTAREEVISWWSDLTAGGGEGIVVKPLTGPVRPEGLVQPGVKVRGREYLRLVYGPEYLEPERLARLRRRSLKHKRSLALREWALGQVGLERLVSGASPGAVLECVLGVLALESEPVDPRL